MLSYEDRVNRVTNYIFEPLDEELDLNTLAAVASPHATGIGSTLPAELLSDIYLPLK